jgi:O-antigen/teichoic acid export membrane protein
MFALRPEESGRQQQDILLDTMVEDITCQVTLKLPKLTLEIQDQAHKRQTLASTAGGAAIAGIGDLIFALLRYLINVVMTNVVTQSVYGIFMATYTPASIIAYIAELGLDSTMVRFFTRYRVKGERDFAAGLLRFVVWTTLVSGVICGAFFFLSSTFIAHFFYQRDTYALPLREVALLIPLIALQIVLASGLQALKSIKAKVFVDRLIQPIFCLVLIGVFYLLGLRLEALILATTCGFLASTITGYVLLHKASRQFVYQVSPKYDSKLWLRFALPMSFNSFIQNIMNSTDVLFLTAFSTAAQVGLYAAADRTSFLVAMPLLAFNTIFLPLIAEYYARGEHEQIASLARVVTKWSFSLSLPVCLCFLVFHEAILSIFSREYTGGGTVLIILSLGNLANAAIGLTGSLLAMSGYARVILMNSIATVAINVGLAFLLVPRFNVIGAAVAAASAVIILSVTYFVEVYCILKIFTLRWDMLKPLAAGCVASLVGVLLLRIIHVGYGYRAIFGSFALIIPFILVYVLLLVLLRFSEEDMMVIDAIRAKFGKKPSV